ncbi:hypothetical protein J1D01_06375 [Seonamhaeicola sp. NFXS20]|uniref:DUF7793 family protein n=1 Tax=Seonamhaeicola sp. NFXS20 TaxID=2816959 RepID=UPI003B8AC9A6
MSNLMPVTKKPIEEIIILENAMFWIDDSKFLHCKFTNNDSNSKLNYGLVKRYINAISKLCKGKSMPFIIDVRNARGTFSISAAKLVANSPELIKLRISEAFVVNTIGVRLLITAYKRIYNPITPFGVFKNLELAKNYSIETEKQFYKNIEDNIL